MQISESLNGWLIEYQKLALRPPFAERLAEPVGGTFADIVGMLRADAPVVCDFVFADKTMLTG